MRYHASFRSTKFAKKKIHKQINLKKYFLLNLKKKIKIFKKLYKLTL